MEERIVMWYQKKGDQVLKELGYQTRADCREGVRSSEKKRGENVLLEGRKKVPSRCF